MGLFFGLFMNAMQFRDIEMVGSVRESTKRALKVRDFLDFPININKIRKISKELWAQAAVSQYSEVYSRYSSASWRKCIFF